MKYKCGRKLLEIFAPKKVEKYRLKHSSADYVQASPLMREVLKGSLTCRQYLPLFDGRIIALFFEGRLNGQAGFYKNYNRTARGKEGTYTALGGVSLGFYPGVSVFATDRISFEFSLPLLEGGYAWNDESSTDRADAGLNHGFVRFKPAITGLNMGLVFHF